MLLEEAGISPNELPITDRNIRLLRDIWRYLSDNDPSFNKFRHSMDPANALPIITPLLKSWNPKGTKSNTIVIDGFYFFTPLQERIIRLIIMAGFEPLFIIPYRQEHPFANEIWNNLYCDKNGYEPKDKWEYISCHSSNDFGELLEGRFSLMKDVCLKEYHNIMGMVDDLRCQKGKMNLYSPNAKNANSILQDFFPERYGLKKISSYPIGAFIRALHGMWDGPSQSLVLDEDHLMDIFTSGWISYDGISSDMVISDLKKILPFFKGCRTINAWSDRSQLLNAIHNGIISHFQPDSDDPEEQRWLRLLDNPLGNFGVFDVDRHKIEHILGLIDNLIKCARYLFGKGESRSIPDHFSRLIDVLQENETSDMQKQEFSITSRHLANIVNYEYPQKFNPSDIINAIMAFLENEATAYEDEDSTDWVKPLFDIEGNKGAVHICLCDHISLPGKSKRHVWPLTNELMNAIRSKQSEKDEHPLIDSSIFITESNPLANRFLIYSAFNAQSITLSWISEDNGKRLAPSPYISLISKLCNKEIEPFKSFVSTSLKLQEIPTGNHLIEPFVIPENHRIKEVNMDISLCHRRYLYGYLLDDHPAFTSNFHYGFAIGGLISALKAVQKNSGFSKEKIESSVFALFPFLSDIEKRNILDRIPQTDLDTFTRYKDYKFTDMRLGIHFPKPIWQLIDNNLKSLRLDEPLDVLLSSDRSTCCVYCPHSDKCPKSRFGGDGGD